MSGWDISQWPWRRERLFGDRVVLCRADRPNDLCALFKQSAKRAPLRDALVLGEQRLSWRDLETIVEETSAGLEHWGITQGDRVALMVGNRPEYVIALFAVARLGSILVPISVREQASGIAYILEHSGARLLIAEETYADRLPAKVESIGELQQVISVPSVPTDRYFDDLRARDGSRAEAVHIHEEDLFALVYTSGTTGRPKGAMVSHVNVIHAAMIYQQTMDLRDGECSIIAVPMTHITGITALIAPMALVAGTLVIVSEFKASEFLELAASNRVTHTLIVPAMYNLLLLREDFSSYDLSEWRIGGYGGAPMPAPTIELLAKALPSLRLMNCYGATETVCPVALMPPEFAYDRRNQVGLPAPGCEIVIMDAQGREVPAGQPGEIWMRSVTVVQGYWHNAEATRDSFVGGFWRSGDVGAVDEADFISVLDRLKDMINRGGYKIYTTEVESVLSEFPGILECAVVAKPCPVLGERVHAFVALKSGATVNETEMKGFCESRLADYKVPESFTVSPDPLPRNANGKLMKRAMQASLDASS